MRAVIFANGIIENPKKEAVRWVDPEGLVVAADGGTDHALVGDVTPNVRSGLLDPVRASRASAERDCVPGASAGEG